MSELELSWVMNKMPKSDDKCLEIMSLENVEKARRFHKSFPQYGITAMADLKKLAQYLGLGGIYVKDERSRFGLNAFNSQTLDVLRAAGFLSATASFELRIQQIRDMQKPLDTEMIIYGRLPVMVSDQCIIRQSSGRCNCQVPGQLADRTGSVFPVMKEFGCRNVIYNAHKLFLADRRDAVFERCGNRFIVTCIPCVVFLGFLCEFLKGFLTGRSDPGVDLSETSGKRGELLP